MKRIQAFGAGVQSVTLLRMILAGTVDPVDRVIFADTQAEPEHVYRTVEREAKLCEKAGIPFDVVTAGDLSKDTTGDGCHVPLFTIDTKTNKKGMLLRQCTQRYKIEPIERRIRELWNKAEMCEQYMGITTDEITRVKPSRVGYVELRYPLIEANMRRTDCEAYLKRLNINARKSACVFCPYRPKKDWEAIRANERDWQKAVAFDNAIRYIRMGHVVRGFVHASRLPLEDAVNLDSHDAFDDECTGYCGV